MTVDPYKTRDALNVADARVSLRHMFVRDLVLNVAVGWHDFEKGGPQRVRFNIDLGVLETTGPISDDLANVVCYEEIVDGLRVLAARDHVNLVETLAEDVAAMCLADPRVRSARVRIEKLDILREAESVGVEIERFNTHV